MNEMREERQRGNDDERKKVKVHRDMIVCLVCCGFMDSEGSGGSSRWVDRLDRGFITSYRHPKR